ncbi:MAG: DNA-directed RNA polymerase subunit F [Hadesarchaea archaeon]|nr:MAG: DNA-directed RNA polymerase subunit F [Hadesarchaea archaeon]HDI12617.1 DNA-directed RNA polymerase subunit F [Hadesarchaea archaeon]
MIGKRVVKEKPVPLAGVLEILEKKKKKGDLEYSQRLTYDYAQKFVKLDSKKAEELKEELLKIEKIREHQAVALVDLMPKTKEDVELIFSKERTRLEEDEVKKVLEIINKYRK